MLSRRNPNGPSIIYFDVFLLTTVRRRSIARSQSGIFAGCKETLPHKIYVILMAQLYKDGENEIIVNVKTNMCKN